MHIAALILLLIVWRLSIAAPAFVVVSPNVALFAALISAGSVVLLALAGCIWAVACRSSWRAIVRFRTVHLAWFVVAAGIMLAVVRGSAFSPLWERWLITIPLAFGWAGSWVALAPAFEVADGRSPAIGFAVARIRQRVTAWLNGPGLIYAAPAVIGLLLVELLETFHADSYYTWLVASLLAATTAGWLGGIWFQLTGRMQLLKEYDASLHSLVAAAAKQVGVRFPLVAVWNTAESFMNAAVLGAGWRQTLLLTDVLLRELNHDQIAAIVRHEAAHVKRRHIWYRLLAAALPISFWLGFHQLHLVESALFWQIVAPAFTMAWMAFAFGWICRQYEFDADVIACSDSNGTFDATIAADLRGALSSIVEKSNADERQGGWLHPSVARRNEVLSNLTAAITARQRATILCRLLITANIACWLVCVAATF